MANVQRAHTEHQVLELLKSRAMVKTRDLSDHESSDDASSDGSEILALSSDNGNCGAEARGLHKFSNQRPGSQSPPHLADLRLSSDSSSDTPTSEESPDTFDLSDTSFEEAELFDRLAENKEESTSAADCERIWYNISMISKWCIDNQPLPTGDKTARDWFTREATQIGCDIRLDEVGNAFAILPGADMTVAPIAMGATLNVKDVAAGRCEEVLGLVGVIEALRGAKAARRRTFAPIVGVFWNSGKSNKTKSQCYGSAVWSDYVPFSESVVQGIHADSHCLQPGLLTCECLGPWWADYRHNPLNAHFELHVGQCLWPEDNSTAISVASSLYGIRQFVVSLISVPGGPADDDDSDEDEDEDDDDDDDDSDDDKEEDHIPIAVAKISEMITTEIGNLGGFASTVPIENAADMLEIDIRHLSESVLDELEETLPQRIASITSKYPQLLFSLERVWKCPAAQLDEVAGACLELAAADQLGQNASSVVPSVEAHDSAFTSTRVPSGIMYVLRKSQDRNIFADKVFQEDCLAGIQILLKTVRRYDEMLKAHIGITPS